MTAFSIGVGRRADRHLSCRKPFVQTKHACWSAKGQKEICQSVRAGGAASSPTARRRIDRISGTQMVECAIDAFSKGLLWTIVVVALIAAVAVVSLLKR